MPSFTSCERSLSPEQIMILTFSRTAMAASVPMVSSASTPGSCRTSMPSAAEMSRT